MAVNLMANELQRVGVNGAVNMRVPISGIVNVANKPIKELRFMPYEQFPEVGREETLYIDTLGEAIYYWNGTAYVVLSGSGGSGDKIMAKTTAQWAQQTSLVSVYGGIYIYTDYRQEDGVNIPAMKIGDGNAYVVDLPFFSTGCTEADRQRWDNKVSAKLSPLDLENLVLYTD
jgi:hypothetical protein